MSVNPIVTFDLESFAERQQACEQQRMHSVAEAYALYTYLR